VRVRVREDVFAAGAGHLPESKAVRIAISDACATVWPAPWSGC